MTTTTHAIPAHPCPECGSLIEAATGVSSDYRPGPGDITVCGNCLAPLEFDTELRAGRVDMPLLSVEVRLRIVALQACIVEGKRRGQRAKAALN